MKRMFSFLTFSINLKRVAVRQEKKNNKIDNDSFFFENNN